jgi:hypothetical protein
MERKQIMPYEQKDVVPEIGMGVTKPSGSDRYPYTVIEIIADKKIVVQEDKATRTDNRGYYTESQDYSYEPNPNGHTATITKRKNGRWHTLGTRTRGSQSWYLGVRDRHNDPHF